MEEYVEEINTPYLDKDKLAQRKYEHLKIMDDKLESMVVYMQAVVNTSEELPEEYVKKFDTYFVKPYFALCNMCSGDKEAIHPFVYGIGAKCYGDKGTTRKKLKAALEKVKSDPECDLLKVATETMPKVLMDVDVLVNAINRKQFTRILKYLCFFADHMNHVAHYDFFVDVSKGKVSFK